MATRVRTRETPDEVGGDARLEEELQARGVSWKWRASVSPDEFDSVKSLGNQARFVAVNEKRVEEYADAMRRGDNFPPVVAYQQPGANGLVVVDGNHRLQAAIQAKKPLKVYDITGTEAQVIVLLSFQANSKHGSPTSEDERIQQALYLLNTGQTIPEAAAAVNLPRKVVEKARNRATADRRFIELGIAPLTIEKLHESVKQRLAAISTDEGFVAMVDLVVRAQIGASDVLKLVSEINERKSSPKQVEFITVDLAEQYADAIQQSAGGALPSPGKRVITPRARVMLSVGNLLSMPDDVSSLAESWVGPERDEQAKRLREAAKRLNALARALATAS